MSKELLSIPIDKINNAKEQLTAKVLISPLLPVYDAATLSGNPIYLKAENLQPSGSFKVRGAIYAMSQLSEDQKRNGVVAYSTGNHAQAVALAARQFGLNSTIVMSPDAPEFKVENTRRYGAQIVMSDPTSQARRQMAEQLAKDNKYALIPPYDDENVIAGQGTIALEIIEQLDPIVIFVPVGGGGLIAGIASAVKQIKPDILVIGVEPELENDAAQSFKSGVKVSLPKASDSVADAIRVQSLGDITYPIIQACVDEIIEVSEQDIIDATLMLLEKNHILVEPSGALGLAAALRYEGSPDKERPVVCIGSGGNIPIEEVVVLKQQKYVR